MGIKDFLESKVKGSKQSVEPQFRLSDIVWATNLLSDGKNQTGIAINVPFIPNRENTRYKNLQTGEIVEMPVIFKGHNPTENTILPSVGLDYSNGGCGLLPSANMLYGALFMNLSSDITKKFKDYSKSPEKYLNDDRSNVLEDFCNDTRVSLREINQFSTNLQKARNERNIKLRKDALAKQKGDNESSIDVRDF